MCYVTRFRFDIWNFRLLTPYFGFFLSQDSFFLKRMSFNITFKYFFKYFFLLYKERRSFRLRRKKPFVYRIDLIEPRTFFRKAKQRFVNLRLVKFYYVLLDYHHFKKINRLAKRKDGLHEQHYILALEGRLVNILYRSTFVDNIFRSIYYIKAGFVTVNWRVYTYFNVKIKLFQIISFLPLILYDIICLYFYRLSMNMIIHTPVRFLYLS